MEIQVTKVESRKPIPQDDMALGFGQVFSDHMFEVDYRDGEWHDPRIVPVHNLELSPAAMCLHYGQEIFEGMKAYRGADDGVYLFRPEQNIARMNSSARRLVMPEMTPELHLEAIKQLVNLEAAWIPRTKGCALYIRPTMIAVDPFLGVRPSHTYLFYIIVGPVAAYYPEGFNPVSIYVTSKYVRAVRGGVGAAKTAGNYAASLEAQMEGKEAGYTQVLFLDAVEQKYVEEVGTMNMFFKIDGEIITSPLTGTILPGVTRDSVLQLLRDWGENVSERRLPIDEVCAAAKAGTLEEVFGTGTAAIISPVKSIFYDGETIAVGDGTTGPTSQKLYDTLLDIQYGAGEDPHGWCVRIDQ
jgi:branched-chain amino acid aminotransferase